MKLYKYRPINEHIDSIFTDKKIWFPKRSILNDPEDLLLAVENDVTAEIYKEYLLGRSKREHWSRKILRQNLRRAFSKNRLSDAGRKKIQQALKKSKGFIDNLGILSLSEDGDNRNLWERYAGNEKGICLEFELTPSNLLLKVVYAESRPELKLSQLIMGENPEEMIMNVLRTKTMKWSDEKEWRCFLKKGNANFSFLQIGNLTGVKFGRMSSQKDKDRVMSLIISSGNSLKIGS